MTSDDLKRIFMGPTLFLDLRTRVLAAQPTMSSVPHKYTTPSPPIVLPPSFLSRSAASLSSQWQNCRTPAQTCNAPSASAFGAETIPWKRGTARRRVTVKPNKRLKLPGGDRSKGSRMFVRWRAQTHVH